jgi:hypothetical protein
VGKKRRERGGREGRRERELGEYSCRFPGDRGIAEMREGGRVKK